MQVTIGTVNEDLLRKSFLEAKKDKSFNTLIESLDLEEDILMKYTSKLQESVEEIKHCKNCKSLHECQNRIKGSIFYPHIADNRVQFQYKACKYEKKRLEDTSTCNYYEMPEKLKLAKMSDIDIDDAKRVPLIKWLKNFYDTYEDKKHQKGLYLHGSFGSGKTYLICAMLNELAKKRVDITIVYYPELLRSLKESFDRDDFGSRMDKLKKVDILFLDDLGAEAVTPWARDEILGTILQYRMDSSLPTFFTSNLTIEELETHLSNTKGNVDKVKSRRIIERIKDLTDDIELVSKNRRGI